MIPKSHTLCLLFVVVSAAAQAQPAAVQQPTEGKSETATTQTSPAEKLATKLGSHLKAGSFHGFEQHDFVIAGVSCKLVSPKSPADGNPWIWRARFWGHQPQLDEALLNKGWHVCYCDIGNLFGNDAAIARWDKFYQLAQQIGLHPKPFLEGMSRGGLIVMRWAEANPNQVSGIYVDNAVMDFRSWPGGKGTGKGSPGDWNRCLQAYQLTEEQAQDFAKGPLDQLLPLKNAGVPIIALINEADDVVPPAENGDLLEKRYRELGGTIKAIRRPDLGHHPHSLKDPAPLVDFALEAIAPQTR